MDSHALSKYVRQFILFDGCRLIAPGRNPVGLPILLDAASEVYAQLTGCDRLDLLDRGLRRYHEPVPNYRRRGQRIQLGRPEQSTGKNGTHLRGECEGPRSVRIGIARYVKRLDAKWVASDHERAVFDVPKRECKHPSQSFDCTTPVEAQGAKHHCCVAG